MSWSVYTYKSIIYSDPSYKHMFIRFECWLIVTFFSKLNSFECLCFNGFTGTFCSNDINECLSGVTGTQACQNNGTCFNTVGSYYCSCQPGYSGARCASLYDICLTLPCYVGTCYLHEFASDSYYCECPKGKKFLFQSKRIRNFSIVSLRVHWF